MATVRIACFGDSLTEGYGLNDDEALPVVLEQMFRDEGMDVTCLNLGMSGDTTGDGLTRIQSVLNAEPDAVILEFGANDCFIGEPVEVVKGNFATIIEALHGNDIPILLVGITALTEMGDEYKAQFDPIFQELAAKYDLTLFPDILSCYFGNSMMTLMDGMHPNDQGVEAIARDLFPQAKELAENVED
ncbi:MAG: arylesterase [Pseudodesulfovibrio sp.]